MNEVKFSEVLSKLHSLREDDIELVEEYFQSVIGSIVLSFLQDGENEVAIDLGFGRFYVRVFSDNVYYQFVPSEKLQDKVKDAVNNQKDPLIEDLGKKINKKLQVLYKEILR